MKLFVVYKWEAYEPQREHKYFLNEDTAMDYYHEQRVTNSDWEMEEIETED